MCIIHIGPFLMQPFSARLVHSAETDDFLFFRVIAVLGGLCA